MGLLGHLINSCKVRGLYVTYSPPDWPLKFRGVSVLQLQRLHLSRSVFHDMFARNDSNDKHFYYKYKYFYYEYRCIRMMKQNTNCNEH